MSANWYKEQPKNRNYLTPVGFKLKLERFEGVDFFCQAVNLPDVEMPFTEVQTRFRGVPIIAGGGVTYGNLQLRFIVDEDMANYTSIWNWIRDNGNAESGGEVEGLGYSGAQLEIHTSSHNTNFVIDFEAPVLWGIILFKIDLDVLFLNLLVSIVFCDAVVA